MKKRYMLLSALTVMTFMFSFLSTGYAQTETQQNTGDNIGTRYVGTYALNVRSNPWVANNIIGVVHRGDAVEVIKKDSTATWCQIDYKSSTSAWVYCPYLMTTQPAAGGTSEELKGAAPQTGDATVNVSALNVRSYPAMGDNIIGTVKQGDAVVIKERDNSNFWCRIDFQNNAQAWVACKYLGT